MASLDEDKITQLTPKALKTRGRIVSASLELFAEKGYQATTLREIAAKAGVSLGLTYRYFAAKEDLVLALYERCADDFAQWESSSLAPGTVARRFASAMRADIATLGPFRDGLGALFQIGLTPGSKTAVLGESTSGVRYKVWSTLLKVIEGAGDAPKPPQARELATALYSAHLMIILFWLQDRTSDQTATRDLIDFSEDILRRLRPALRLPLAGRILKRFVRIIQPMFGAAQAPPDFTRGV